MTTTAGTARIDPLQHPRLLSFWDEKLYAVLTTVRPGGAPHAVPVSVTYEPAAGTARVVSRRTSRKVRNIAAAGADGLPVALCQHDGGRWSTLEGRARVVTDPAAIEDAEQRYAARYGRRPSPNPERVLIEVAVERVLAGRRLLDQG